MTRLQRGTRPCRSPRGAEPTSLVVVTGGPGAGKTAVLEIAQKMFCAHVATLPEAATIVFGGGFPRHSSRPARAAAQRAIFFVQRELERLVIDEGQAALALCDRGTVDGMAYWPGSPERYWREVETDQERELARYAAVIHLEVPPADGGYQNGNPLRVETAAEARAIDLRISESWRGHPRRFVVPSTINFVAKAARALELITAELCRLCPSHGGLMAASLPASRGEQLSSRLEPE